MIRKLESLNLIYVVVHFYRDGSTKILCGMDLSGASVADINLFTVRLCVTTRSLYQQKLFNFQGSFTNFIVVRLIARRRRTEEVINEFIWSVANFIKDSLICAALWVWKFLHEYSTFTLYFNCEKINTENKPFQGDVSSENMGN